MFIRQTLSGATILTNLANRGCRLCLAPTKTKQSFNTIIFPSLTRHFSLFNLKVDNYIIKTRNLEINKNLLRSVSARRKSSQRTELADKFKMEWPKITLFGDSITRRSMDIENGCWASMISHRTGSYFDVDVRGFDGYNSKWALELMPQLFPRSYIEKVELFVLFFGHNDSWTQSGDSLTPLSVPVDEYESNMRSIIKYLNENGLETKKIIMITPTWYHEEAFVRWLEQSKFTPVRKSLDHAAKYSEAVLRIAKDAEIDVIDFFEISKKEEKLEAMFCDGVHYSQYGAKMLFNELMPMIERKIEASYGKPLVELWHACPFEQRPELESFVKN